MKTENKSTLWDFLEANMTNYYTDQRIAELDRLARLQEEELTEDEIVEFGFFEMSISDAHAEEMRLTDLCFAEALENFTKKSKIQMVFETMLKGEYVMVSESALEEAGVPEYDPKMRISSIYSDRVISLCNDKMDIVSEINTDDIEFIV